MFGLTDIWKPNDLIIVILRINGEDKHYSAYKSRSDSQELQIFENLDAIIKHFGNSSPYHVHVIGSGVINRQVEYSEDFKRSLILNADPDEFMFTHYTDSSTIIASFFRIDKINEELEYFSINNLHLLGVSSGVIPAIISSQNVNFNNEYIIQRSDGHIHSFQQNPNSEKISDFTLIQGLLNHYLNEDWQSKDEAFELNHLIENTNNYKDFKKFKLMGLGALSFILVLLVANYFYQNSLNNQVAQLESDLSLSASNLGMLDQLTQEQQRKEQIILSAGINSKRFFAFYLDEIGASVPGEIKLSSLELFPLTNKLRDKEKVEIDHHTIDISGLSNDNIVLDNWMEELDKKEWVSSIELLNYSKGNAKMSNFRIQIRIN